MLKKFFVDKDEVYPVYGIGDSQTCPGSHPYFLDDTLVNEYRQKLGDFYDVLNRIQEAIDGK